MILHVEARTFLTSSAYAEYTPQDKEIREFSREMLGRINKHYFDCYGFTPLQLKHSESNEGVDEAVLFRESIKFPVRYK